MLPLGKLSTSRLWTGHHHCKHHQPKPISVKLERSPGRHLPTITAHKYRLSEALECSTVPFAMLQCRKLRAWCGKTRSVTLLTERRSAERPFHAFDPVCPTIQQTVDFVQARGGNTANLLSACGNRLESLLTDLLCLSSSSSATQARRCHWRR